MIGGGREGKRKKGRQAGYMSSCRVKSETKERRASQECREPKVPR